MLRRSLPALRRIGDARNVPRPPAISAEVSRRLLRFLKVLGPGLITGASDDDPSGIATYSQAGARFGTSLLWTNLFSLPLMAAVQEICARMGRVTGKGIAANLRDRYPRPVLLGLVTMLFAANTLNLGADLAAMGEALRLLVGGQAAAYAAAFAALSLGLEVGLRYRPYAKVLKWATLVLFSYVAAAFFIDVDWASAFRDTFVPTAALEPGAPLMLVAVLGTTISPYLFFWQSSEEAEELKVVHHEAPLRKAPGPARRELRRIRLDTVAGMALSNLVGFFIMLSVSETLHRTGHREIETAAQAAEALRPLAGPWAYALFTLGIVGTGLLAVPVLAGSSAFAVSEAFGWPAALEKRPHEAKGFYSVVALGFLLGAGFPFLGLDPIKALVASAVLNGLVAVPVMAGLMHLATSSRIMGAFRVRGGLAAMGWAATACMTLAALVLFVTEVLGRGES
jgi:Mn2+/Fe2+ NRAMP family transporter